MRIVKKLVSLEIPSAHLSEIDPLIDFHFVIATELTKNVEYFNWYSSYLQKKKRKLVMLDNGVYEEGTPMKINEYISLIKELNPDVVFAPDVLFNTEQTFELVKEFLSKFKSSTIRVGVIPQGDTPLKVIEQYKQFESLWGSKFEVVGLSFLNDRQTILQHWSIYKPKKWYHMLGLQSIHEIQTWPKQWVSFDTVKPIKAAYHGYKLEDLPRGIGKWSSKFEVKDKELLFRNILELHRWATIIQK